MLNKNQLNEGLRTNDLRNYVSDVFAVDRYKSKMGEDEDILVLSFKVKEKYPAIDLMEFIEKGYPFILDADMSAGEENDGQYQVFVEIERTPKLTFQLKELMGGISQLCDIDNWHFNYQKFPQVLEFNEEVITQTLPMTAESYREKIRETKESDIRQFFDQGATEISLAENNTITFRRPYAGDVTAKFVAIGSYDKVKEVIPGKLSLDETSQSQVLFLNKFLGNYDIDKIGNKFLIRNKDMAIVIEKDKW